MPEMSLQQFVPSEVCLKCDGCCRYKEADSIWRPKLGEDDQVLLSALITAGDMMDTQGYIKTQSCGGPHGGAGHSCKFFNGADNTCGIYNQRPFECSLYPFIISQTLDTFKVYVHLSCPYVQDHLPHGDFDAYKDYLKGFFHRPQTQEFLSRNKAMFHDYSPYAAELLHVFDLSFL